MNKRENSGLGAWILRHLNPAPEEEPVREVPATIICIGSPIRTNSCGYTFTRLAKVQGAQFLDDTETDLVRRATDHFQSNHHRNFIADEDGNLETVGALQHSVFSLSTYKEWIGGISKMITFRDDGSHFIK